MEEQQMIEEETQELVQMIMVLDGQDRYQGVLQIWSVFIGMVFQEERTKAGQSAKIRSALKEHEAKVRERAAKVAPENRSMSDAGELMAMQFIAPVVAKAFDFSTYSASKRCAYIRNALCAEIESVKAQIEPVRHILEEFRGEANG